MTTRGRHSSFAERARRQRGGVAVPELQFSNARPTFRASMRGDLTYDRVVYPSDFSSGDIIWWDYWDQNYDRRYFDTSALEETIDGVDTVGGVELLVPGKYEIYAQIEFDKWFSGPVRMQTNYDDGQGDSQFQDQASGGDSSAFSISRDRFFLGDAQVTAEESFVYIVVYHAADIGDLVVPGGFNGPWGVVPMLNITYVGAIDGPTEFGVDANF